MEDLKAFLASYETIPREMKEESGENQNGNTSAEEASKQTRREKEAIREIRRMLNLIEKRIDGCMEEKDRQEIRDSRARWMESIQVLREVASGSGK